MRELLGPEAPAFLASYRRPAQRAVRANPLKLDPAALPALLGIPPDPVPWCPEAWFLPDGVRVGDTLAHAAGLCYVQEPSALAVADGPRRAAGPPGARPGRRPRRQGHPGRRPARRPGRGGGQRGPARPGAGPGRQPRPLGLGQDGAGRRDRGPPGRGAPGRVRPGAAGRALLGRGPVPAQPGRRRPVAPRPRPRQRRAPARPPRRRRPPGPPWRRARLLDLHLRPRGERAAGGPVPDRQPGLGAPPGPAPPGVRPRPPRLVPRRPPRAVPNRPPLAPPPARRRPLHRQARPPRRARDRPRNPHPPAATSRRVGTPAAAIGAPGGGA